MNVISKTENKEDWKIAIGILLFFFPLFISTSGFMLGDGENVNADELTVGLPVFPIIITIINFFKTFSSSLMRKFVTVTSSTLFLCLLYYVFIYTWGKDPGSWLLGIQRILPLFGIFNCVYFASLSPERCQKVIKMASTLYLFIYLLPHILYSLATIGIGRWTENFFGIQIYQYKVYYPETVNIIMFLGAVAWSNSAGLSKLRHQMIMSGWMLIHSFYIFTCGVRDGMVMMLFLYFFSKHTRKSYLLVFILLFSLLPVLLLVLFPDIFNQILLSNAAIQKILYGINDDMDELNGGRGSIIQESIQFFFSSPFIGISSSADTRWSPHNMYVDLLIFTGVIGFVLFLFPIIIFLSKKSWYSKHPGNQKASFYKAIQTIILSMLVICCNTNVPLRQPTIGLIFFSCVGILAYNYSLHTDINKACEPGMNS
jgi:hypothetical protein